MAPAVLIWLLLVATLATLAANSASAATLKADYGFQDTRASSVAGASPLTDLVGVGGANTFATENVNGASRRVLSFPKGNGLSLPSVQSLLPSGAYSVVTLVRLMDTTGWRRYLEFTDGLSDNGFYARSEGVALWSNGTVASGGFGLNPSNAYAQIAITRDPSENVVAYIGPTAAFPPYADAATDAARITGTTLRFFQDSNVGVPNEDSAGAVSRIRVYEGALTAAEVAALAPGGPLPPDPGPRADGDGDGVPDSGDACPTIPAQTPNGCPAVAPAPPVLGKAVNVERVRGEVFVSVPAGAARAGGPARTSASVPGLKGRVFVPLSQVRQIPVGSILDTRKGTVRIVAASTSRGRTQKAEFLAGVFAVAQSRSKRAKGLTELRLKGESFRGCAAGRRSSTAARASRMASRRTIRRLRGRGAGRFRTRGRYSSATVRGTDWTVSDRCDGTLTKVKRGRVAVRDFRKRKTVLVTAGKSYLSRARR